MNSSSIIENNCNRHYALIPSKSICSGHGVCVNDQCICDSGWTFRNDFSWKQHYDCDQNIMSAKILGLFIFIFSLLNIINIHTCNIISSICKIKDIISTSIFCRYLMYIYSCIWL